MGDEKKKLVEVKAKMSGVFYRSPAPEEPAYVEAGTVVEKKQILALLETMKVFQKVKSPVNGTVVEVVAENETPVKDDEVMFIIEKG
jgi:acetyl-CoA carboxylase biotin carboxyl carrier protein